MFIRMSAGGNALWRHAAPCPVGRAVEPWRGTLLTARKSNRYPATTSWAGPIQEKSLKGFFLQWA